MRKYIVAAAVVITALLVSCGEGTPKATKKEEPESHKKTRPADAEVPDVVQFLKRVKKPASKIDSLSSIMGMTQTNGMKDFLASTHKVDTTRMDLFYQGMIRYFNAKEDKDEFVRTLGTFIAAEMDMSMLRYQDYKLSGNDSTEVISREQFLAAFINALEGGNAMGITQDEAISVRTQLFEELLSDRNNEWRQKNADFMAKVATRKGVKKLGDHLYYEVITEGTGEVPANNSIVKVNYEGKLMDGTVFDSSYERGEATELPVDKVIPGWTEALTNMPVGSKWRLYIGQEKAYGAQQAGSIRPFSALEFTVELLEIVK